MPCLWSLLYFIMEPSGYWISYWSFPLVSIWTTLQAFVSRFSRHVQSLCQWHHWQGLDSNMSMHVDFSSIGIITTTLMYVFSLCQHTTCHFSVLLNHDRGNSVPKLIWWFQKEHVNNVCMLSQWRDQTIYRSIRQLSDAWNFHLSWTFDKEVCRRWNRRRSSRP